MCVCTKFQCKLYYESQFLKSEVCYSKLSVQVWGGLLGWVLKAEKKSGEAVETLKHSTPHISYDEFGNCGYLTVCLLLNHIYLKGLFPPFFPLSTH